MPGKVVGGTRTEGPVRVSDVHTEAPVRTGWTVGGSAVSSLGNLTDVDTAGETAGDILEFDGQMWRPESLPAAHYTHVQLSAANPWVIDHGLGFPPAGVLVFDGNGVQLEADLSYPDPANRVSVTFPFGMSQAGIAYLS